MERFVNREHLRRRRWRARALTHAIAHAIDNHLFNPLRQAMTVTSRTHAHRTPHRAHGASAPSSVTMLAHGQGKAVVTCAASSSTTSAAKLSVPSPSMSTSVQIKGSNAKNTRGINTVSQIQLELSSTVHRLKISASMNNVSDANQERIQALQAKADAVCVHILAELQTSSKVDSLTRAQREIGQALEQARCDHEDSLKVFPRGVRRQLGSWRRTDLGRQHASERPPAPRDHAGGGRQ